MKVLLVSPQTPNTFWSFKHVLPFVSKRAAFPPLGLLTVAAMLPKSWQLKVVDLNVSPLRNSDIEWADYVMISAMIVHKESVDQVIARCESHDKPIVGGGPLFTTSCDEYMPRVHCVVGEAEDCIGQLVSDLESGRVQDRYEAPGRPSLEKTPVPRWDLINTRKYASMSVQFSRGCPYDCEFCDIVVMNGRRPRTKAPARLIAELDSLHRRNWRGMVFVVDDNFIGNKAKVKELLREIINWRERTGSRIGLYTEASVNLADDAELLDLMVKAGFQRAFLGIETPVVSSLEECDKLLNSRRDMAESVRIIHEAGIEVMGGFIVGFDNDPKDIFERQFEFIQKTGIVTAMVGLLNALPQTKLYHRLLKEGRLLAQATGNNTAAFMNFVPKLDSQFLVDGYRQLMRSLYEPKSFYRRALVLLSVHRSRGVTDGMNWQKLKALVRSLWVIGVWNQGRRAFWKFLFTVMKRNPRQLAHAVTLAIYGYHFRRVAADL